MSKQQALMSATWVSLVDFLRKALWNWSADQPEVDVFFLCIIFFIPLDIAHMLYAQKNGKKGGLGGGLVRGLRSFAEFFLDFWEMIMNVLFKLWFT